MRLSVARSAPHGLGLQVNGTNVVMGFASAAAAATGLQLGDRIVKIDGTSLANGLLLSEVLTPKPTHAPTSITCTDGTINGDETDVDCGGSCPPCGVGEACATAADCESAECAGGVESFGSFQDAVAIDVIRREALT